MSNFVQGDIVRQWGFSFSANESGSSSRSHLSHSDSAKKEEVEERRRTDIAMDIPINAHGDDNRVDEF